MIRVDGQRALEARQRFVESRGPTDRAAEIVPRLDKLRLELDRLAISGLRVGEVILMFQRRAEVVVA